MDFWPWLIGIIIAVAAYVLWFLWKNHTHPALILLRQAVNMNWVAAGMVEKDGYRNVRLTREDEEAVIWYKTGNVLLVRPHLPLTFNDFIELERWMALEEERAEEEEKEDEELKEFRLFLREFERIIMLHGYFEELLSAQGTDEQFSIASMKLQRAGFFARKTPAAVAALILKALAQYDKTREGSLEFLAKHEKEFQLETVDRGDASGEYNRAGNPTKEVVTPQDDADMARCRLLAEQGNSTAQSMLGVFYASGDSVPQNYAEALKWLRLAADQGNARAQGFLASMYKRGEGVPQNDAEALKWYRLAADQGDASAQSMLGKVFAEGWYGHRRDYIEAKKWYHLAANQGDATAQITLGGMSYLGRGAPQDYAEAAKWYRLAANQGNADGLRMLGSLHGKGQGVPQDYTEATRCFRLAADQGDAAAQCMLGTSYHQGHGVPQNYSEALKLYRLAADQGERHALLPLGLMYANGRGVLQDNIQAYKWCSLSLAQDNESAKKFLDILSSRMTPAQIAEAQKLAREWKPATN